MTGAVDPKTVASATVASTPAAGGLSNWMEEVETTISAKSSSERVAALRNVTSLFLSQSPALAGEAVALFDDVLTRLVNEVNEAAQLELANKIAALPNAPMRTIRTLSQASIAVASPVLTQSPRLTDLDLVEIVKSFGDDHRIAISRRRLLSTAVTDALVAEGGREVLRTVVRNAGAEFSGQGFSVLLAKSTQDDTLQMALGKRGDLPETVLTELLATATEKVRAAITPYLTEAQRAAIANVLAKAGHSVASNLRRQQLDYGVARAAVEAIQKTETLGEDQTAAFAREGKAAHVIVALSVLTRLPVPVVEAVVLGEKTESILIICRSLDFRWSNTKPLVALGRGALGEIELDDLANAFQRMTHATAGRIVRFLAVQQAAARE
jgi:uncharacterized protein (DUF2336 family)